MNHRWKSVLIFVGGWLLGAVFVRLALDWSDAQPYEGAVTERRYLVIAGLALALGIGASIAAAVIWARAARGPEDHNEVMDTPQGPVLDALERFHATREELERFVVTYRSAIDEIETKVRVLRREFTPVHD
ncbi:MULTISPECIES: hypothetical protein [Kocuria]|uniref:hypothetical protein n=1 Tax=Kocuria TaxID=57493 RepID=UPI000AA9DF47